MSQASKPKKMKFPDPLGTPIERLSPAIIVLLAKEISEAEALGQEDERIERVRVEKLKILARHYGIYGDTPRFWFDLARRMAIDLIEGFKVVEMGGHRSPGRPARWKGMEGLQFLIEVESIMSSGLSLKAALTEIQRLDPARYGGFSLKTLENRYREAFDRHRK